MMPSSEIAQMVPLCFRNKWAARALKYEILLTSSPEPLVHIQHTSTLMFLMLPSTISAKMVFSARRKTTERARDKK